MRSRIWKIVAGVAVVCILLVVACGLWVRSQLAGSLPQLDGTVTLPGLTSEVTVERDALGIPTIQAGNRLDLAFATGFLHAQDRFFQMDLLRRNSAGELAELVGPAVVNADKKVRLHRFRNVAQRVLTEGSDLDRSILEAYAAGANAGLAALKVKPFEYLLLGVDPAPWKPEDSALVMFSMFLDLQDHTVRHEAKRALIADVLGDKMLEFLAPKGTRWDAPVVGQAFSVPAVPGPEAFNARDGEKVALHLLSPPGEAFDDFDGFHPGSNNWAVAGTHTADGGALVADDMHLGIRVPHIWYRASFRWPTEGATASKSEAAAPANDSEKKSAENQITGVTLPGTPALIVGSNGHVAWGFTNSEGDWADLVLVDVDPNDKDSYLTPDGPRKFEVHQEPIKVKGAPDEKFEVVSTIWGPISDRDNKGRPRAIRWVAYDTAGVNMGLMRIESAETMEEAMRLANLSGSPAQNFVVADNQGRIGWTILGRMPRRVGYDGWLPTSWADGTRRWDGYLEPAEYPRIISPETGRIWTANARVVDGEMLAKLGDGGYDLGARAGQIRDDLLATDKATPADMLRIQLDDRAVFLEPWRNLLLETLTPEAIEGHPQRAELRKYVDDWGGRAGIGSVGYRAVREFRRKLLTQVSDVLVSACKKYDDKFSIAELDRTEGPVWALVSEKPAHLLDPRYESWNELLLAAADQVIAQATEKQAPLARFTWGSYNTTKIQHPLSLAVPRLAAWLDMPARELDGDSDHMPRIQAPDKGASQRMAVSPGREADGYFHMPCGQSGHPLSPHYGDAHEAWEDGKPTPFLPGKTVHTLVLKPKAA